MAFPKDRRAAAAWIVLGLAGFCLLPWYVTADGLWSGSWLTGGGGDDAAAARLLVARPWLAMPLAALGGSAVAVLVAPTRRALGWWLTGLGGIGVMGTLGQG